MSSYLSSEAQDLDDSIAIFTVVSNNYLHFARTLLRSARAVHPEAHFYCVIVDRDLECAWRLADEFEVLQLNELDLPDGDRFCFRYSVLELNTAVKPWAFEALLKRNYGMVIYIDPDIRLYRPLEEVVAGLGLEDDIIVTPHLLAPIDDDKNPTELDIRRAGTYNFGFCAVRNTTNVHRFVKWWQSKLRYGCVIALDQGIFVDQSWIDLVPGLFDQVAILRHPGYNVAYWNLAQRNVTKHRGGWTVNGEPLVFFHYSGLDPLNPRPFSKHQDRLTLATIGLAAKLVKAYVKELHENGFEKYREMPYGFGFFDDGEPIPAFFHVLYRNNGQLRDVLGSSPFSRSDILIESARIVEGESITWAMLAWWEVRVDLQAALSLTTAESVRDYRNWFVHNGSDQFSQAVIAFHRRVASGEDSEGADVQSHNETRDGSGGLTKMEKGPPLPVTPKTFAAEEFAAHNFVQAIFLAILGRPAEMSALVVYRRMLSRPQGRLRVWKAIATSGESRARGGWMRRSWKGLRIALRKLPEASEPSRARSAASTDQSTPATASPADSAGQPEPAPDHGENYPGDSNPWFQQRILALQDRPGPFWLHSDADTRSQGNWTGSTIRLALPSEAGGRPLRIVGEYPAEAIAKQTGSDASSLAFFLRDQLVHIEDMNAGKGRFDIRFDLPKELGPRPYLTILAEKHFIPSDISESDDGRGLALRLKTVEAGDLSIFDCTREQPVLFNNKEARPPGINLIAYIKAELGVGEAARSLASSARSAGIPYSVIDVGYQSPHRQTDDSALEFASPDRQPIDIVYVNADQTPATLNYLRKIGHESRLKIGVWAWEQPVFPDRYLGSFWGLNEVWVPSTFVQDAVSALAPVPVLKIPHAVRFEIPKKPSRKRFGLPSRGFLALVMYDLHSYQFRKNPDAAISAFRRAAGDKSGATLVIKTIGATQNSKDFAALKKAVQDLPNVVFITEFLSREEVYELQACCDVLLSLHRAEGFGLAPAEMMFLSKPVIATGWSGNMDFMTPMNSYPVEYELKPLAKSLGVYEAGSVWAEADVDHAAWCLRQVIDDPAKAKDKGRRAGADVRSVLAPETVGRLMRNRLNLLAEQFGIA